MENWLPWHRQMIASPWISDTGQPWWVQMLLNALNSPSVGCVTTYLASSRMTPPPTGTSAVATLGPDGAAGADDEADADGDAGADADGEAAAEEEAGAEGAALVGADGAATSASAEQAPSTPMPPPTRAVRPAARRTVRRVVPCSKGLGFGSRSGMWSS